MDMIQNWMVVISNAIGNRLGKLGQPVPAESSRSGDHSYRSKVEHYHGTWDRGRRQVRQFSYFAIRFTLPLWYFLLIVQVVVVSISLMWM